MNTVLNLKFIFTLYMLFQVFSMSLQGQSSRPLKDNNEVIYRIYAKGNRIVPQKSLCLLWNQAAERLFYYCA